ncbi:MAG: class I SAM-dependent methyltransferase [Pirellulales bacterium]
MVYVYWIVAALAALVVFSIGWRVTSRRWSLPCPSLLSWCVEGPIADWFAGTNTTLERLRLKPGQTILEVGPGPGRLLVPASFRVLPGGRAIGVDIQFKMIELLKRRAAKSGVTNLTTLVGDATALKLPGESVDLAYLCTVLGEIPDRAAALAECYRVLKPGGALSITEIMGDPHYQTRAKVERLAKQAGFEPKLIEGGFRSYTASFRKP